MSTNEEQIVNGSMKKQLTHDEWLDESIKVAEALMDEYADRPESEEYQAAKSMYLDLKKEQRSDKEYSMKAMKNRAEIEELRERNRFNLKKWGMGLLGDVILGAGGVIGEAYGYMLPTKLTGFISSIRRTRTKE